MSQTVTYTIDPAHSRIYFSVKHMMIASVRGEFQSVSGTLSGVPGDHTTLDASVSVDTRSLSTGVEARDNHVKSADFLDVEQFPTMTFSANGAEKDDDEYEVKGHLTLHGNTKPITLTVTELSDEIMDPWGNKRIALAGKAKLNRKDYGLVTVLPMDGGGVVVGDDIKIEFEIEATRQA